MSSVPSAFNVYDIVGHWVPGVVVVTILLPVAPRETLSEVAEMGAGVVVFGIAITYAIGFLLSAIGTALDRLWSACFGFAGHGLLKQGSDGFVALSQKLEQVGVPRSMVANSSAMFTAAMTLINRTPSGGDRASRFYAASMLSRSLCVSLMLGVLVYAGTAWQFFSFSPFGWFAIACAGGAVLAWIRARVFSAYFSKEVVFRALMG